jgi:hypothetical protein
LTFHSRYWPRNASSAPIVFRSTNRLACGSSDAMSSPLIPVMSGIDVPPLNVVSSFCLKSPPTSEYLMCWSGKCAIVSSSTDLPSPPGQHHNARLPVAFFLVEPVSIPDEQATTVPPSTAARPPASSVRRDKSMGLTFLSVR